MQKHFNELMEKELSRKDFLKFLIGGAFVIFGMNNLTSYVTQYRAPAAADTRHGFGSRKFGA